jgi:PAS domain S-box-containing protein
MATNAESLTYERLKLARKAADLGIWEWNVEEDRLIWDERMVELFGFSPDEGITAFYDALHPEDRNDVRKAVDHTLRTGDPFHQQYRIERGKNTTWLEAHGKLVQESATDKRVIGTVQDITEQKEREQQLHQERRRFRQVAEHVREVFWLTPPDKSEMLYISPAYEEIWGRSREDLYNNPESWLEAIHPDDRDGVRAALPDQRSGQYEEEYRIVRPNGETRWIRDRAYSIQDDSGNVTRVVGVAEDITDRKQMKSALQNREQLYRTLFEEASEGFLIVTPDDRLLAANQSAGDMLGYEPGELEGMSMIEITPPEFRERCGENDIVDFCLDKQGTALFNWHYLHRNGSSVPVANSLTPVDYRGTEAVLICMRDLSVLRRIRRQTQRKSSFVTQVTHDLRTPLNSITGMGDLLMDTDLTGKQQTFLRTILNAARNMERLTNDIIDLNRIERGEIILEHEPFDVHRLVEDVISLYSHEEKDRDVIISQEVSDSVPKWLIGDPDRLKQILFNLMDNAIEHTRNGYVQLQVEPDGPLAPSVPLRFSVSDTGCGIPESQRETIFQQHEQLEHGVTGSPKGLGIGLSICKHLVEEMNGEISVRSEEGKGSTFSFTIELEQAGEGETSSSVSLDAVNVLLVEDNSLVRKVFLEYLGAHEINASECETGEQALAELIDGEADYDVVLLDQRLDDLTGVEVLQKLAETDGAFDPKRIYIVSGDPSDHIQEQLGTTPCAGILEKPVDESTLITAVRTILRERNRGEDERELLQEEIQQRDGGALELLVVDDDQNTRTLLNELLSPVVEQITFVTNGEDAVEQRFDGSPDLILMDLEMPGMNGREATELIRTREASQDLPSVPIIIQTAKAMRHVETDCLEAGADRFLRKPIRRRRLYKAILDLLT